MESSIISDSVSSDIETSSPAGVVTSECHTEPSSESDYVSAGKLCIIVIA